MYVWYIPLCILSLFFYLFHSLSVSLSTNAAGSINNLSTFISGIICILWACKMSKASWNFRGPKLLGRVSQGGRGSTVKPCSCHVTRHVCVCVCVCMLLSSSRELLNCNAACGWRMQQLPLLFAWCSQREEGGDDGWGGGNPLKHKIVQTTWSWLHILSTREPSSSAVATWIS